MYAPKPGTDPIESCFVHQGHRCAEERHVGRGYIRDYIIGHISDVASTFKEKSSLLPIDPTRIPKRATIADRT